MSEKGENGQRGGYNKFHSFVTINIFHVSQFCTRTSEAVCFLNMLLSVTLFQSIILLYAQVVYDFKHDTVNHSIMRRLYTFSNIEKTDAWSIWFQIVVEITIDTIRFHKILKNSWNIDMVLRDARNNSFGSSPKTYHQIKMLSCIK